MRYVVERPMVAHLWAHQSQDHARTALGNFYFNGKDIYSYGSHFKCATIVTNNQNEKAYLVTTKSYSNTTNRHMSMVRNAIPTGSIVFNTAREVSSTDGRMSQYHYRQALAYIIDQLEEIEGLISKQKTSRSQDYRNQVYAHILNIIQWNEFWGIDKKRKASDGKWQSAAITRLLSTKKEDKKTYWNTDLDRAYYQRYTSTKDCKHLQKLLKMIVAAALLQSIAVSDCYNRLSQLFIDYTADPDLWIKFQARLESYARKRQEEEQIARLSFEEKQQLWRSGEINTTWFSVPHSLGYNAILRIRNGNVETSMGIKVLPQEASRLWRIIKIFKQNPSMFKRELVEDASNHKWQINSFEDGILTVGCHRIPYIEMEYAAQQLGLTA